MHAMYAARLRPPWRLADVRVALRDAPAAGTEGRRVALSAGHDRGGRVAAVAAVLRERGGEVELLFIRRAKRRGDPWSGHMAWPGGKREGCDADLLACAVRETREEIGLDLEASAQLLGGLTPWHGGGKGPKGLRGVVPFVFALTRDVDLRPGDEVQETIWIPLSYFTEWSARRPWRWVARWLPRVPLAYRYDGRVIWGLTLWMLADLLQRLAAGPQPLAAADSNVSM